MGKPNSLIEMEINLLELLKMGKNLEKGKLSIKMEQHLLEISMMICQMAMVK